MQTTNLISTPAIEGNIGSCKTEVEKIIIRETVFRVEGFYVQTNSCNGEVKQNDYSSIGTTVAVFVLIAAIILLIRGTAWAFDR